MAHFQILVVAHYSSPHKERMLFCLLFQTCGLSALYKRTRTQTHTHAHPGEAAARVCGHNHIIYKYHAYKETTGAE